MTELNPRQEAFCQAYAAYPNASAAARAAGYAPGSAGPYAARLLASPPVRSRLADLGAEREVRRLEKAQILEDRLLPVYEAALAAGDHDTVQQVVELQARIAGLVHGGATLRPRAARPAASEHSPEYSHEQALAALMGSETGSGEPDGLIET